MLLSMSVLVTLAESENMFTAEICTTSPSLYRKNTFINTRGQETGPRRLGFVETHFLLKVERL